MYIIPVQVPPLFQAVDLQIHVYVRSLCAESEALHDVQIVALLHDVQLLLHAKCK